MTDTILNTILTPQEYAILTLIKEQRERLKKRNRRDIEPTFTLQQNYIVALFHQSYTTVNNVLDRLTELGVISVVSNRYGECVVYRYHDNAYQSLLQQARAAQVTLYTGRKKTPQTVSAQDIINYMIGKSVKKKHRPRS